MNLRKIGVMIHRCRMLKRNSSKSDDFKQDGFLTSSIRHPFFEIHPGFPVCSRGTMLRLEQGKDIHEEELYRFFLRKLGENYAYSPSRERIYDQCFNAFDHLVCEGSLTAVGGIDLPITCPSNLLYDFYDRLLRSLYLFYTLAQFPPIELMCEIAELWFCVPEKIRPSTAFFIISAQSAHPFYDRIDFHPVCSQYLGHPLGLLTLAMIAAADERFIVSGKLMARYDKKPCAGDFTGFLRAYIVSFTKIILRKSKFSLHVILLESSHPLQHLMRDATLFQLGKYAVHHRDYPSANLYFATLEARLEPYGVFAAWVADRPYRAVKPENPKLECLTIYLADFKTIAANERLAYLMKKVVPMLGKQEEFLLLFMRLEVIELALKTQRYKCVHDYVIACETLRKG
jgi:hypothetical protein